ncbi:MAG: hypothetical protein KAF91_05620 [Nostoc sp. TH1S01]|nr:hypothetical protein [Nostoc sp. TH1S01]
MTYAYEKFTKAIDILAVSKESPRQRMIDAFQVELHLLIEQKLSPEIEEDYQKFLEKYDEFIRDESEDINELVEILMSIYEELILIEHCPQPK